jgi:hypothetical protein
MSKENCYFGYCYIVMYIYCFEILLSPVTTHKPITSLIKNLSIPPRLPDGILDLSLRPQHILQQRAHGLVR